MVIMSVVYNEEATTVETSTWTIIMLLQATPSQPHTQTPTIIQLPFCVMWQSSSVNVGNSTAQWSHCRNRLEVPVLNHERVGRFIFYLQQVYSWCLDTETSCRIWSISNGFWTPLWQSPPRMWIIKILSSLFCRNGVNPRWGYPNGSLPQ